MPINGMIFPSFSLCFVFPVVLKLNTAHCSSRLGSLSSSSTSYSCLSCCCCSVRWIWQHHRGVVGVTQRMQREAEVTRLRAMQQQQQQQQRELYAQQQRAQQQAHLLQQQQLQKQQANQLAEQQVLNVFENLIRCSVPIVFRRTRGRSGGRTTVLAKFVATLYGTAVPLVSGRDCGASANRVARLGSTVEMEIEQRQGSVPKPLTLMVCTTPHHTCTPTCV